LLTNSETVEDRVYLLLSKWLMVEIGYRQIGCLRVMPWEIEAEQMRLLVQVCQNMGIEMWWVTRREVREMEPMLAPQSLLLI
jgi:L-2-hydroxyglutarate oxidase LhgO